MLARYGGGRRPLAGGETCLGAPSSLGRGSTQAVYAPLSSGLAFEAPYSSSRGRNSRASSSVRRHCFRAAYLISWYAICPTEPVSVLLSSCHRLCSIHSSPYRARSDRGAVFGGRREGKGCEPFKEAVTQSTDRRGFRTNQVGSRPICPLGSRSSRALRHSPSIRRRERRHSKKPLPEKEEPVDLPCG